MRREPFIKILFSILIMVVGPTLALAATASTSTVELPTAIHFLTPAGDDIKVGPGIYEVEAAESWLKLVPEGQGRTEAVLLEATPGIHEGKLEQLTIRLEEAPDNPDVFHLAMLLADGTGLEAIGTKSGIRTRGLNLTFVRKSRRSRNFAALPKISLPGPVGQTEAPRSQPTCGPATTREVGSNIGEKSLPTLAMFRNQLHLVASPDVHKDWFDHLADSLGTNFEGRLSNSHYVFDGTQWSNIGNAPGRGKVALAYYDRNLWAVWREGDKQLWFSRYFNQWAPPTKIPGQYSKSTPALGVRQGVLHMVHNGKSSDDLWHSTFTPRTQWTPNVKIGQKSRTTPGFTLGRDGNLHMVYLGAGKRGRPDPKDLWYSQFNGRRWTTPYTIQNQFSKASPALLGVGTTSRLLPLGMVHLGKSENTLWHALYGKNPRLPVATQKNRWHANERLLGRESDGPVGLTFSQGCIHMVHKEGKKFMHTTYSAKEVHKGLP